MKASKQHLSILIVLFQDIENKNTLQAIENLLKPVKPVWDSTGIFC